MEASRESALHEKASPLRCTDATTPSTCRPPLYLRMFREALVEIGTSFDGASTQEALGALERVRLSRRQTINDCSLEPLSPKTMEKICIVINHEYRSRHVDTPLPLSITNAYVKKCWRERTHQSRVVLPITLDEVRLILDGLDSAIPLELGYKAILGLLWTTAAYPREIRSLRVSDVELHEDGSVVVKRLNSIGHAEHDQISFRISPSVRGSATTCVASAVRAWIARSGCNANDTLFPVRKRSTAAAERSRAGLIPGPDITASAIRLGCRRANIASQQYSALSFRLGYIVHCWKAGVNDFELCVRTGYKDVFALHRATKHVINWDENDAVV